LGIPCQDGVSQPVLVLHAPPLMKGHKHVLVALGWYDYPLHRGIERYAQEHGWLLSAHSAGEKADSGRWEGDGILAWLGH